MTTETVRVFAWKARWLMINLTNWSARSTFDCSKLAERIAPNWPVRGSPISGWPEVRVSSRLLLPVEAMPSELGNWASASCTMLRVSAFGTARC